MSSEHNHDDLLIMMGEIKGITIGTDRRLKKINGVIERHEVEIKDINKFRNRLIGKITIITGVGGVLLTLGFILINKM